MNRRGQFFITLIFLILASAILFGSAYFKLYNLKESNEEFVGHQQIELEELYVKGHTVQNYLDLSAKSVVNKAIYRFEQKGHMYSCGQKEGYYYWESQDESCYPSEESVRRGFANVFVREMNDRIFNFKMYDDLELKEVKEAEIDIVDGKIRRTKQKFLDLEEDPSYFINENFEIDASYDFYYDGIVRDVESIKEACSKFENYNLQGRNELDSCVEAKLAELNQENREFAASQGTEAEIWSLNCEGGDEAVLDKFAEKLNNCLLSADDFCGCGISSNEASLFSFDGKNINYKEKTMGVLGNLPSNFNSGHLFKQNGELIVKENAAQHDSELCRQNDRTVKLCVAHPTRVSFRDGDLFVDKKVQTKFAIYIPDESPPPRINFRVEQNGVYFEPSIAGDVELYSLIGLSKDLGEDISFDDPVWIDAELLDVKERFGNMNDQGFFPLENIERLNVMIIAEDDDGNLNIPS